MDGTLAVAVVALALIDARIDGRAVDPAGGFEDEPRWAVSSGLMQFQNEDYGGEVFVRHDFGTRRGPLQPTVGLSVGRDGTLWAGGGILTTIDLTPEVYLQGHIMAGMYGHGDGPDLGSVLQFRSGLEVGFETQSGVRIGIGVDHRSNADTAARNPGLETIMVRVSIPTG